jgi:Zn-dependent M16 (insulinase) family peptidase
MVFEVQTKAFFGKQRFVLDMVKEVVLFSKLSDTKRLKEILEELQSRFQTTLVASGHVTSMTRALSYVSPVQYYSDLINGIGFYRFLEEILSDYDAKKDELVKKLQKVVKELFVPEKLLISYTSNEDGYKDVPQQIEQFGKCLYSEVCGKDAPAPVLQKKNEGFKTASQVQYVARVGNFKNAGMEYTGALKVLSTIMNYGYLWQNIRVKGGAYGCMSGFFRNGDSYFVSYRDPSLEATNEVYKGIPEFLEQFAEDEREMTKYVIGTISDIDTPLTPKAKGSRSLMAYVMGIPYDMVQKERDEILGVTQEEIQKLAPYIRAVLEDGLICAVGNEEKIEASELFIEKSSLI